MGRVEAIPLSCEARAVNRWVLDVAVTLLANAIALVVAALVLDRMGLGIVGFAVCLVIFTVVAFVAAPLFRSFAKENAPALVGLSSLVATLVSLIVTAIVGDSLVIRGLLTWVLAAVLVWLVAVAARLLLSKVLFRSLYDDDL